MPKIKQPFEALKNYIPEGSYDTLMEYILHYRVKLTVTRKRQSILGDYRHPHKNDGHRISINENLNPYAFLITLLHELAHLLTYEQYGNRVKSHGAEWKRAYAKILHEFMQLEIFPAPIYRALEQSIKNPAASSCSDEVLLRVLRHYDKRPQSQVLVEQLQQGDRFVISQNRIFEMVGKARTRYKCKEVETGKMYLFSAMYEVKILQQM